MRGESWSPFLPWVVSELMENFMLSAENPFFKIFFFPG
jgi:hypothetical protein